MTVSRSDKVTQNSLNINKPKKYSDFTTDFSIHPNTGDLFLYTDANAVKQALKNLIKTKYYERKFKEKVGSNLESKLFEQMTGDTLSEIGAEVRNCITNYEKRVSIVSLQVTESTTQQDSVNVALVFTIANIPDQQTVNIVMNRVR